MVFSGRPAIHIHDSENERFLDPHQETNQCARDFLFIWAPLFDAKGDQGGLEIYKKSHKHGYWKHQSSNKLGSSHLKKDVLNRFEKQKKKVAKGAAKWVSDKDNQKQTLKSLGISVARSKLI